MPRRRKRRWVWDPEAARYRWPNTGRAVPPTRVAAAREALIRESDAQLRGLADRLSSGEINLRQWNIEMRREIQNRHMSLTALGAGGRKHLSKADRWEAQKRIAREYEYLQGFTQDLAAGKLSPAQLRNRASLYGQASARDSFHAASRRVHEAAGFQYKSRVGPNDDRTCDTCASEIGDGRVPIDRAGWQIGHTICGPRDRCEILYHRKSRGR